jgi:hypothetical protein
MTQGAPLLQVDIQCQLGLSGLPLGPTGPERKTTMGETIAAAVVLIALAAVLKLLGKL